MKRRRLTSFVGAAFILVFLLGGALLAIISAVLSFGLMALKIVLPIVLVVWVLRWLMGWNGSKPDEGKTPPTPQTTGHVSDM